nr:hypothetical protein Iba_chr08bCG6930 [Ipomoea batatas]GMD26838.1 hypothetical protein Iba_chr08dCG8030 [Ipomoea batatas]GMD27882.1 hypothetical protein Iba_chr08eCG2090 [Ipomoea batatas]
MFLIRLPFNFKICSLLMSSYPMFTSFAKTCDRTTICSPLKFAREYRAFVNSFSPMLSSHSSLINGSDSGVNTNPATIRYEGWPPSI